MESVEKEFVIFYECFFLNNYLVKMKFFRDYGGNVTGIKIVMWDFFCF